MKPVTQYKLPVHLGTMDEQIRTGGEDSYALQAECSKTPYGKQMAAEMVRRWNCHNELIGCLDELCKYYAEGRDFSMHVSHPIYFARVAIAKAKGEA